MLPHHNQHTLPKFFISGFYDSADKPTKNPFVWYYPLAELSPRKWRRERAQDISVRGDFYTLPGAPPQQRLALEELFSRLESDAAGPLRRLAQGRDPEGLGNLSLFLASMSARPPAVIEGFGAFASRLLGWPATSYPDRARNKPDPNCLPEGDTPCDNRGPRAAAASHDVERVSHERQRPVRMY